MINNMPAGDVWYLHDADDKSPNYGKRSKFCFEPFKENKIKLLIKSYVWQNHQTGTIALRTIYGNFNHFKKFNTFASQKRMNSLHELDISDADNFMTFLRLFVSGRTRKPLSYAVQAKVFNALRTVIYWGQIFAPDLVPAREIFIGNEYPGRDIGQNIDFISDDVVKQINGALLIEENPYVKYGFIILFSTGMRLCELLNLEVDCITPHLINGDTLTMYDFKNRRQHRKIPITPICADAIVKLTEATAAIREKADERIKKYLFIYEVIHLGFPRAIKIVTDSAFRAWVNGVTDDGRYYPGFMDRHNIIGSDGKIYKVKIHQVRKTVATDMFSKGVNLKVIQEFLRHAYPHTTKKYYADDKDIDRAMIFEKVGIIGNINKVDASVIADENELAWFMENKDKGAKMCDGYCTMPIVSGKICEKLANRQKCYGCNRYITTPEYLQTHKEHLAELEAQIANNIYGNHYSEHLSPTVAILKDIIQRLEAIRHEL